MISVHYDTSHITSRYGNDWLPGAANLDFDQVPGIMTEWCWSPVQWTGGIRHQKHFNRAFFIALDFDDGEMSLAEAINTWCDCIHVIGTTRSHQVAKKEAPACDRFRVLLKLDRVVEDVESYRATVSHYVRIYGSDRACVDGARFFFPCKTIASLSAEGYTQEVLPPKPRVVKDYSFYREFKSVPRWIQGVLKFGVPIGQRNSMCFKIGKHLYLCGFDPREIIIMIHQSPIDIDITEIERAVKNGVVAAKKEQEDGA